MKKLLCSLLLSGVTVTGGINPSTTKDDILSANIELASTLKGRNFEKVELKTNEEKFLEEYENILEQKRLEEKIKKEEEERLKKEEERLRKEQEEITYRNSKTNIPYINFYDLTEKSNISIEALRNFLERKESKLSYYAETYVECEEIFGVNALFLATLTSSESWHGKSDLANSHNNIGGVKTSDGSTYRYFDSKSDCIYFIAELLSKYYLNPNGSLYYTEYGGKTVYDVNHYYCPNDNNYWSNFLQDVANYLFF